MTQFFEDNRGCLHPISRIHRIAYLSSTSKPTPYDHRVYLDDDGSVDVDAQTVRMIRHAACTVLPAQPGTLLLEYSPNSDDNPEEAIVWRAPVLGWRIGGEYEGVEPVVVDAEYTGMTDRHAILHSGGQVEMPCGERYDTEEEWFAQRVRFVRATAERTGGAG